MKNIFLPALIWALALGCAFAQKQQPVSAINYLSDWRHHSKKLMDMAGHDSVPFQKKLERMQGFQTRSMLQLDSTITFFGYDPTSSLDSLPLVRVDYAYNPQLFEQVAVESWYDFNAWYPATRTATLSDDLGRLVNVLAEYYDHGSQSWQPDSKIEAFPHGNLQNGDDSIFIYSWSYDLNDWELIFALYNEFDSQDRLIESSSVIDFFGLILAFKDIYYYNTAGDNYLIESYLDDGGMEYLIGKQELTYANHHVTTISSYSSDGLGGWEPFGRITYAYTGFWKEMEVSQYIWDFEQNTWLLTERNEYEYDQELRLSTNILTTYDEENGTMRNITTWSYLEEEYIALEEHYSHDFDLQEDILLERKYFYYSGEIVNDAPSVPIMEKSLGFAPNPAAGFAQIQISDPANVQVFDMQGRLVRELRNVSGHYTLDLQGLPSGTYQVKAQTKEGYYSGRLVKQ